MSVNALHIIAVLALLVWQAKLGYEQLTGPEAGGFSDRELNVQAEPLQSISDSGLTFKIEIADGLFDLAAQAKYRIAAKVASKEKYYSGWSADVVPYDLALICGSLTEESYSKQITYSQGSRFYYYRFKKDCRLPQSYIATHSANCHIIPGSPNLKKALAVIEAGDLVEITGYLVNLSGTYKNRKYFWNSSLSRNDTGNGACELIFAEKIRIGEKIYFWFLPKYLSRYNRW